MFVTDTCLLIINSFIGNCLFFTKNKTNIVTLSNEIQNSVDKREERKPPTVETKPQSVKSDLLESKGRRKQEKKNVFINKEIEKIVEKITKIETKKMCESDVKIIQKCLKKHFFFGEFTDAEKFNQKFQ